VLAFGVPGAAGWLFILPWIVAGLTVATVVLALRAWRQGWWTPAHRAHYALVATACVELCSSPAYQGCGDEPLPLDAPLVERILERATPQCFRSTMYAQP